MSTRVQMAQTNSESNGKETQSDTTKVNEKSEFKIDGEMIAQGAEAKVYKSLWKDDSGSKMTVVKHRFPKKYRHPQLDLKLRRNRSKKVCGFTGSPINTLYPYKSLHHLPGTKVSSQSKSRRNPSSGDIVL